MTTFRTDWFPDGDMPTSSSLRLDPIERLGSSQAAVARLTAHGGHGWAMFASAIVASHDMAQLDASAPVGHLLSAEARSGDITLTVRFIQGAWCVRTTREGGATTATLKQPRRLLTNISRVAEYGDRPQQSKPGRPRGQWISKAPVPRAALYNVHHRLETDILDGTTHLWRPWVATFAGWELP